MKVLRQPILASLLQNRLICLAITGATILQLSLVASGRDGWRSPIHDIFGIPDPGCGLTRAIIALLRGDWWTSLAFHAFAPLFVLALTLIALNALLPAWWRDKIATGVESVERGTGVTAILLLGLVLYWLARLLILRETYLNLIAG